MADDNHSGKIPAPGLESLKRELLGFGGTEPPKGGRFKPGQSGNPKGRPKRTPAPVPTPGERSLSVATARLAQTSVSIKEHGESISIPMFEAIIRAQMASAAKGNPLAQRDALVRIERALFDAARDLQEKQEFWARYRDEKWAEIEQAKRNGEPLPNPLPHPDDIVIEPGQEIRIKGPIDEADMARCAHICLFRDTLLLQDALDVKLASTDKDKRYRPGGSVLWAMLFDHLLYKRFRLREYELAHRIDRNSLIPLRTLLKTVYQAWRTLGMDMPRGTRFASVDVVKAIFDSTAEIDDAVRAGDIDQDEFLKREYNETALEIMTRFKARASTRSCAA